MFRYCKIRILISLFAITTLQSSLAFARNDLLEFQNDTARIHHLFQQGNLYINGPSDSLLFYAEAKNEQAIPYFGFITFAIHQYMTHEINRITP